MRSCQSYAGMVSAALVLTACVSPGRTALYPSGEPHRAEDVVELSGHVYKVDGKEVSSLGSVFELLPGCHIVTTPMDYGRVGPDGGWIIKTGHVTFALNMTAGRRYGVEVRVPILHTAGAASVVTTEKDAQGNLTQTIARAQSEGDIVACRERAALGAQ